MGSAWKNETDLTGSMHGWAGIAATLCVLMVEQPMVAAGGGRRRRRLRQQIQGEERVLHALNRFTFGPRPGDVAAVQAMGLQRWFERQLNPSKIDDSALDARLAMFPAMQMQQAELVRRYPSPQVLRQMIAKNLRCHRIRWNMRSMRTRLPFTRRQKAKQEAQQAAAAAKSGRDEVGQGLTGDRNDAGAQRWRGGAARRAEGGEKTPNREQEARRALPGDDVDPSTPDGDA